MEHWGYGISSRMWRSVYPLFGEVSKTTSPVRPPLASKTTRGGLTGGGLTNLTKMWVTGPPHFANQSKVFFAHFLRPFWWGVDPIRSKYFLTNQSKVFFEFWILTNQSKVFLSNQIEVFFNQSDRSIFWPLTCLFEHVTLVTFGWPY